MLQHPFVFNYDYAGMCVIASYTLHKIYKKLGYKTTFAIGEYDGRTHGFLIYNGDIIDITATQFGLRRACHIERFNGSKYEVQFKDNKAIYDMRFWDLDQNPRSYRNSLKSIENKIVKEFKV